MIHKQSRTSLYLIVICGLAILLRVIALDQSFWLDEAAQAVLSLDPFSPGHFDGDFQPPLSYYVTYVWMELGNMLSIRSEWFLRLPMVGFGVGTVLLLYSLLKDMFDKRVGLLGSLMLATAPFHIYYSQEFRMYAMLTFFAILGWYFLWHKRWKWLIITTTIGIFTHYFAFINLAAQIVYILTTGKRDVQKMFISAGLGVAPFVFWIPTFMKQLQTAQSLISTWPGWENISNTGFIRFPGLVMAKFTVGLISPEPKLFYGAVVSAFSFIALLSAGGLFVVWLRHAGKQYRQKIAFLGSMFLLPLLFAWIGGIFISASSPWRIQFVLPGLYALIAVAVWEYRSRFRTLVTICVVYLVVQNLFFTSQYLFKTDNHRENWRDAVAYTDSLAQEGAMVLTEFTHKWAPIAWYSDFPEAYHGGSTTQKITPDSVAEKLDPLLVDRKTVPLYTYLFEISDPHREVEKHLKQNGYEITLEKDYRGVGIIQVFTSNYISL